MRRAVWGWCMMRGKAPSAGSSFHLGPRSHVPLWWPCQVPGQGTALWSWAEYVTATRRHRWRVQGEVVVVVVAVVVAVAVVGTMVAVTMVPGQGQGQGLAPMGWGLVVCDPQVQVGPHTCLPHHWRGHKAPLWYAGAQGFGAQHGHQRVRWLLWAVQVHCPAPPA